MWPMQIFLVDLYVIISHINLKIRNINWIITLFGNWNKREFDTKVDNINVFNVTTIINDIII